MAVTGLKLKSFLPYTLSRLQQHAGFKFGHNIRIPANQRQGRQPSSIIILLAFACCVNKPLVDSFIQSKKSVRKMHLERHSVF